MADWTPESRVEEILFDTINGEEYTGLPESRIEELLLELKEVIEEGGGGGGGTTNYNALENKPQINSVTLSGDKSLADLGIIAEIKKVMDMITGQFDTTANYEEGDIVIYDKKLYIFTEDHTAGEWDSTEASQTTIEDLLSSIGASSLSELSDTDIGTPSAGEPLIYDAISSKWKNGGVVPIANGGTGNADGYIRTGRKANTNVGGSATILGANNQASGTWSYAEGYNNTASGNGAHVEGEQNTASGITSHAEGGPSSKAQGTSSHAEGQGTTASGHYSHAEGASTVASGQDSHAEGNSVKATAAHAHAQNYVTEANAQSASAAGDHTVAGYQNQFVIGKYNNNKSTSLFEVGNGTGALAKSNALELDSSGNLKVAGTITDGDGNILNPLTQAEMETLLALI